MTHSPDYKKRRTRSFALLIILFLAVLTAIEMLFQQLNNPVPIINNLIVFTLVNVNIILLVVLIVVVVRNLAKLYFERKNNILGSKFQTKLIISFIILSLIPTVFLSVVASNLITQSIEGWFNVQIEHSLRESLEVAQAFYENSKKNSLYFAEQISEVLTDKRMLREVDTLHEFLSKKQQEFNLGLIEVYSTQGVRLARAVNPNVPIGNFDVYLTDIVHVGDTGKQKAFTDSLEGGDLIKSIVPIRSKWEQEQIIGVLMVDYFVDGNLASKMQNIQGAFEQYKQIKIHKNPILGSYLLTFLQITLLVFFSAIWFGMHLAKGMTIPIQKLALGTKAIADGNLDHKVEVEANDEVGILVDSFNQMTERLKNMTDTLTERRRYIETILENIATGVVSITPDGYVTTFNRAASRILQIDQGYVLNHHYRGFLDFHGMKRIMAIIRKMHEEEVESYEEHLQLKMNGKILLLLMNVTTMYDEQDKYLGTLIVFDDLTQLIKAQQIAAWRDVARRLAHEIKNPLTPLQLSAQRLRWQAQKKSPRYEEIFEECTQTIIDEVRGLRHLVDEFSRFARMPAMVKKPMQLHALLKQTLSSYPVYYKQIRFHARFSKDVPVLHADVRQLKQVFVNLIDNAIQAMNEQGELYVHTSYDAQRGIVTIRTVDTGHGIPDDLKERLFIPYFSTKGSGRGLGLAIVHKIISEHGGSIKIEDNAPRGTVFVIELPAPVYPQRVMRGQRQVTALQPQAA
ncbi:nitrogen regulation sensor histidine kinase NtrY, HAMP and PAS domain-containing [Candidatus Vecturithrix granuli]|uniref:histidine kinase n=1 Tax=Vecturithrix granuli TaxID=1499967 RepID=A0A0S6W5N6_VECG1|nr:nitrogen regulation sensor histidine kinase NtrY, HAMP and PAS domain-containing [Candidatus Vecturithrix granuli]